MIFADNGRNISITMNTVNDPTMKYTTLRYTDANNTEQSIHIENSATVVTASGLKTGASYTLTSTFNPVGAGDDLVDAFPYSSKTPDQLKVNVAGWTAFACSDYASGMGPENIIDGSLDTQWHSQWSPTAAPLPHWIILDMGSSLICNVSLVEIWRGYEWWWLNDTHIVEFYTGNSPDAGSSSWVKVFQAEFGEPKTIEAMGTTINIPAGADVDHGRYLKLVTPDSRRTPYTNISELYFYGKSK
jgi:hypothetical protein